MIDRTFDFPRVEIPSLATAEASEEAHRLMEAGKAEQRAARAFGLKRLVSLIRAGKHVYMGTVPAHEVAKRRAKGKRAKAARRINR